MATGLKVVSVTGSSAGCCFRRRRFCGRFLCCCEEEEGGDWFPSPPEDEAARGAGAPVPGVALPSSFFSPLLLPSSGVAAAATRERRGEFFDRGGRATTIRALCDAATVEAPGRAAERGARACCIVRAVSDPNSRERTRCAAGLCYSPLLRTDLFCFFFFFKKRGRARSF